MTPLRQKTEAIQDALEAIRHSTGVPGISVAVDLDGEELSWHVGVASLEAMQPWTSGSRFEVSCLMKFFVSILVYREYLRGSLDLDTPVFGVLADLRRPGTEESAITLSHLMSHCSGLRGLDISNARTRWAYSWKNLQEHFSTEQPSFPPGTVFNYEHSDHVLLGEILRRVLHRNVGELVIESIFDPLGVTTGCAAQDRGFPQTFVGQHVFSVGSNCFVPMSSPPLAAFWGASLPNMTIGLTDVCRIGRALLADTTGRISEALEAMQIGLPRQVPAGMHSERIPVSFGRICGQYEDGLVGHNGSVAGQTVGLRMNLARRISIAVGVNAWSPKARDDAVAVVHGLLTDPLFKQASAASPVPFLAEELTGGFESDALRGTYVGSLHSRVQVSASADGLDISVGASKPPAITIKVVRKPDGRFAMDTKAPTSCSFTPHPIDGSPVCHLGVHAYRKLL